MATVLELTSAIAQLSEKHQQAEALALSLAIAIAALKQDRLALIRHEESEENLRRLSVGAN